VDDDEVVRRRFAAQGLAARGDKSALAVAGRLAGLQAQDTAAMRLAVRARVEGLTADDVRAECGEPGRLARTWLMRGTLHLVPAKDVRWMLELFGARNIAATKRRRDQLGLDEKTCDKALARLPKILGGAALSRAEIVQHLDMKLTGQAVPHLMAYAASKGLICRGPDLAKDEPGYVLLDEWAPDTYTPDDPLSELAKRYGKAYGPATAEDFAAWSGLPASTFRAAKVATARTTEGRGLRLLGRYDTYLLGYRDRSPMLDPAYAKRIQAGGGVIHPAVVVDGRVAGRWQLAGNTLKVEAFGRDIPPHALTKETADLARFLGTTIS